MKTDEHIGNEDCRQAAKLAARHILNQWETPERMGFDAAILLGSGWGRALQLQNEVSIPLARIPGFSKLRYLKAEKGHELVVRAGIIGDGLKVCMVGRIHLYQQAYGRPHDDVRQMVRLESEMLYQLLPHAVIVTAGVGALPQPWWRHKTHKVGDIVVCTGFITKYAPRLPLYDGDGFPTPAYAVSQSLKDIALRTDDGKGCALQTAIHIMLPGPNIEGLLDKTLLGREGGTVVGLSILETMAVGSLYPGIPSLALALITNGWEEKHDHDAVTAAGDKEASRLADVLTQIISQNSLGKFPVETGEATL